jgi:UDP-N-acetylmuramoylalanine--D-glutamate ligase
VVGLARSGAAAARLLVERGEEVIGVDSGRPDVEGFEAHLESDGLDLVGRAQTVIKSPGVPHEAPVIVAARERGTEVIGELELAWRVMPDNQFVAVTGTNGKTTTVELLGAIYREAGLPNVVAGNVGTPLSSVVGSEGTVICECSSFQLEDTVAFAPECAVLLNLEPDHLDRHGTFEDYRGAKLRVFANQGPEDVAVAPPDIDPPTKARVLRPLELDPADVRLRGPHNLENAGAAAAAALARGVPVDAVRAALRGFAGVPHRLEEVGERGGVTYVNDSKATNVASALVGIRSFEGGVHLILGGSLKGESFARLREPVMERCAAVYLIGQASDELAHELGGTVPIHRSGDLETAVAQASTAAGPGDVVLLSPACASYDQFRDYEARGDRFRDLLPPA